MLTYLAIGFVMLLVVVILYGFGIVMRRHPTQEDLTTQPCVLCKRRFKKAELIEREIGDYKLLYFCAECITKLRNDAARRNGTAMKEIPKS